MLYEMTLAWSTKLGQAIQAISYNELKSGLLDLGTGGALRENGSDYQVLQHLPQVLLFESNFFPGAHWMEERQTEEKRLDITQKQVETLRRMQALSHDWDKWSRLENSSSRLCPADFG
ncbi:hypothetical protein PoB_006385600 [Plakobranchus ocellatus]|uniref:Uncharacterized protein n=1 Tax=Plakobranchus ocellatus TaxID=259542 RepID=A0AAV4D038_9GAST|nr:hypothetical protein PoB_006385600 [Plakobranchus ocellatus]